MMNAIKYEGSIPAKLRMVCDRNRHAVKEVTYHDGWATDTGMSYEVVLRDGWRACEEVVHSLLDTSAARMAMQIRSIERCDCADCKRVA